MFTHESENIENEDSMLIKRMNTLKYHVDVQAICFGLAHMAKQAILSGEWVRYNKRLEFISKIPVDKFRERYKTIKEERSAIVKSVKEKAEQDFNHLSAKERSLLGMIKI